jgi:hypothetical protein
MNAQAFKFLRLPPLVWGTGAVLVSGIAIASLAFSGQGFNGVDVPAGAPEVAAVQTGAAPASRRYRCAECGVIMSVREVNAFGEPAEIDAPSRIAAGTGGAAGAKSRGSYEITVRLRNGSTRVITDAKPARWTRGEPVTIIAGVNQ